MGELYTQHSIGKVAIILYTLLGSACKCIVGHYLLFASLYRRCTCLPHKRNAEDVGKKWHSTDCLLI